MEYNTKILKKLRNNFFVLSASIFLVVIIGAFIAIYINIYFNVQQEIEIRIESARSGAHMFSLTDIADPLIVRINLSETQEISSVNSLVDIPESTVEQLVYHFLGETSHIIIYSANYNDTMRAFHFEGPQSAEIDMPKAISIEGRDWRVVSSVMVALAEGMGHSIILLEVTDFNNTLSSLMYTLLMIALVVFPIVTGISYYFSKRAIKPIEEAWEKQKQFIADASHELKTPITIIKSNLGIVMSNPNETVDSQMEWLGYVNTGAYRMSKLANDLLSLANAERPDLQMQKDNFDISVVTTDLIHEMTAKANEKSTKITASVQPNIILYSDREKILQIAAILFDNAIKYSGPNGWVEISLAQMNQSICLEVANSGKGIKKAELHSIFGRFYQTEPSRNSKNEGFGLGLSIAKALSEKLGGNLSVSGGENESTVFTFVL